MRWFNGDAPELLNESWPRETIVAVTMGKGLGLSRSSPYQVYV